MKLLPHPRACCRFKNFPGRLRSETPKAIIYILKAGFRGLRAEKGIWFRVVRHALEN